MVAAAVASLLGLWGVACAGPRPSTASRSTTPTSVACATDKSAAVVVVHGAAHDVVRIATAVPAACATLVDVGLALDGAVPIRIHDDVDGFVKATGQVTDTVRAWSTADGVHLLTLASWHADDDEAVRRRLAHELCHVALLRRTRAGRPPPRAIAEGLCSVVAGQHDERLPLEEVRRRLADGERVDFVADSVFSYGVAHHVVAGLWRCRGGAALLAAVDAMAAGVDVVTALGAPPLSFLDGCPGSAASPEALQSPL